MTLQLMFPLQSRNQQTRTTGVEVVEWEQVPVATNLVVVGQEVEGVVVAVITKGTITAVGMIPMVVVAMMTAVVMTVTMVMEVMVAETTVGVGVAMVEVVMVEVVIVVEATEGVGTVVPMGETTPVVVEEEVVREAHSLVVVEVDQEEVDQEVDRGEVHVVGVVVLVAGADVVVHLEEEEALGELEGLLRRSASLVVMAIRVVPVVILNQRGLTWITAARSMGSRTSSGARIIVMVTRESSSGTKIVAPGHSSSGSGLNPDWQPFNLSNQICD